MVAPVDFDGQVEEGARYVLVDDEIRSGGTLAALADHIRRGGGEVVGAVALGDASRSGRLTASPETLATIRERGLDDVIREQFGIEPEALTGDEAEAIALLRDADELRDRATAAHEARDRRLRSRGIRPSEAEQELSQAAEEGRRAAAASAPDPEASTTDLVLRGLEGSITDDWSL